MNEEQKNNEDFIKKLMDKSVLEKPSSDFTLNVMQVLIEENKLVTQDKPLISRQMWLLILVCLLLFFSLIFYFMNWHIVETPTSTLFNNSIGRLFSNLRFSKTVTYSLLIFSVFSVSQVFFIKSHFDKHNKN